MVELASCDLVLVMTGQIPRIIHQSWKNHEVPPRWAALQQTWIEHHPQWEYRFWTDDDNRRLIAADYPELLSTYDAYPLDINRAEMARYMAIRRYGGVYVDLDFECLRPVDQLIAGHQLVFGLEPETHAQRAPVKKRGLERIVCNAFIASIPDHPFWQHLAGWLERSKKDASLGDRTSFFLLTRACDSFADAAGIAILPPRLLYPIDNVHGPVSDFERSELARTAYGIHHWHGSWLREAALEAMHERISAARRT